MSIMEYQDQLELLPLYAVPLNNEVTDEIIDKDVNKEIESAKVLKTRLVIGRHEDHVYVGFSRDYEVIRIEKDVFEEVKVSSFKVP
jgi:hypothetical protein